MAETPTILMLNRRNLDLPGVREPATRASRALADIEAMARLLRL